MGATMGQWHSFLSVYITKNVLNYRFYLGVKGQGHIQLNLFTASNANFSFIIFADHVHT